MRALHAEQRPRSNAHEMSGTFSSAVIWWPHDGQRERGFQRLKGCVAGAGSPRSSAHWAAQSRSIILGSRWMTTLRNEPMHRPSANATQGNMAGEASTETTSFIVRVVVAPRAGAAATTVCER